MFRKFIKVLAKRAGYEIVGYPNAFAGRRSLLGLLQRENINLVLDVGANVGQFACELRAAGYSGRIMSFEPLASAHQKLRSLAAMDPNWTVSERAAIGAEAGTIDIHVSENSVSSSILDMLASHSEAAPESSYVSFETVPVQRLDDVVVVAPADRILLKIDVQGYERQVIEGGRGTLSRCRAVISEMSLVPLYDGQATAREIWDLLEAEGFEPWSLESCFRHPLTGQMLQLDGAFVRKKEMPENNGC